MSETPTYARAAVVASHAAAARAARDVMIEGGNAIEAAVAAAAVCSIVLPHRHGLGGDALWIIREAGARGRTRAIDARGPAVQAATLRHYRNGERDRIPAHGAEAVLTVPGEVAGWIAALDLAAALGGKLPASRLLEPAVRLARDGFPASKFAATGDLAASLVAAPGFAEGFLVEGKLRQSGSPCLAPQLADTLSYLAHAGLADFYRGDIGREMALALEALGSPLGRDDLRQFEARWRTPETLPLAKGTAEAPPTGRGLLALAALGLFDRLDVRQREGFAHRHGVVAALNRAHILLDGADQDRTGSDLLSGRVLAEAAERIDMKRASAPAPASPSQEDGTWIGIVDATGLAVSLAHTIGSAFGSGCLLPRTGILMGNRGAGFSLDDDGPMLRPGRRAPMDSLPALLRFDDGRVLPLGGVGPQGPALVIEVAARIRLGASLAEAVEAPRLLPGSSQDGPVLFAEEGVDPSLIVALRRAGHLVEDGTPAGEAGAVLHHSGGRAEAAADPRREAEAAGF